MSAVNSNDIGKANSASGANPGSPGYVNGASLNNQDYGLPTRVWIFRLFIHWAPSLPFSYSIMVLIILGKQVSYCNVSENEYIRRIPKKIGGK